MKLFKAILISLSSVLLMNCIGDDISVCLRSCILHFSYPDFPDHINNVHVGVFNADGLFVTSYEVDKRALSSFQGVTVNLVSGNYTAMCWGNAFDHTQIDGFIPDVHFDDGRLSHPNHGTLQPVPTNDSLYYGKCNFTIDPYIKLQDTIDFTPAHIKLQIQVKGLSNTAAGTPVADYPFIRVNDLLPVYDFHMQPSDMPISYYPPITVEPADKLATVLLNVFRFDNDTPATIDVVKNTSTQETIYTLSLRDFMLANSIVIVSGQETTISILITFFDGNVTVSLNGWGGTSVNPEL